MPIDIENQYHRSFSQSPRHGYLSLRGCQGRLTSEPLALGQMTISGLIPHKHGNLFSGFYVYFLRLFQMRLKNKIKD